MPLAKIQEIRQGNAAGACNSALDGPWKAAIEKSKVKKRTGAVLTRCVSARLGRGQPPAVARLRTGAASVAHAQNVNWRSIDRTGAKLGLTGANLRGTAARRGGSLARRQPPRGATTAFRLGEPLQRV